MQRATSQRRAVPGARRWGVHAQLLLVSLMWGATAPAIKYVCAWLQPFDLFFLRAGGAAALFAIVMILRAQDGMPQNWRDAVGMIFLGLCGSTLMNIALAEGQRRMPVSIVTLVVTTNPIWTALIAAAIGQERLTPRSIGGIGVATLGFLLVLSQRRGMDFGDADGHLIGMLILSLAPLSWAMYTVFSKPYLERYDPIQIASWTAITGLLCATPLLVIDRGISGRIEAMPREGWPFVLFLAIGGYFLASLLWCRGLQVLSASQAAVYVYLVPLFGTVFAWIWLDEPITPRFVLGAAVVIAGVALTNSLPTSERRSRDSAAPL